MFLYMSWSVSESFFTNIMLQRHYSAGKISFAIRELPVDLDKMTTKGWEMEFLSLSLMCQSRTFWNRQIEFCPIGLERLKVRLLDVGHRLWHSFPCQILLWCMWTNDNQWIPDFLPQPKNHVNCFVQHSSVGRMHRSIALVFKILCNC